MAEQDKEPEATDPPLRVEVQPIFAPRRPSPAARDAETGHQENLAELADLMHTVKALSQQMGVGNPGSAEETRDKPVRRWKKVVRLRSDALRPPGAAPDAPSVSDAPDEPADILTLPVIPPTPPASSAASSEPAPPRMDAPAPAPHPAPMAPPPVAKAKPPKPPRAAPKPKPHPLTRKRPVLLWIAAQAFGFGLVMVGYFMGKLDAPPPPEEKIAPNPIAAASPPPTPAPSPAYREPFSKPSGVSERAFQALNEVLAASKRGDAAKTQTLLEDIQRQRIDFPGLDYRFAALAVQRGDLADAKQRLDRAATTTAPVNDQTQTTAAACFLRAYLAGLEGNYKSAVQEFETAAYAEPFNARHLFFLGEALRRSDRLRVAVERLEQALLRPVSAADAEYIAYKLRLAKIEAGRSSDLTAELAEKIKRDSTPGYAYWLLTAAAQEMQREEYPAAAAFLQKAARAMPTEDFNAQMRDYFFVNHASHKEVASYLARANASASKTAIPAPTDPIFWTLQNADPASWPAAAGKAASSPAKAP
jgi:tetratricopeptide (TPR) repeat protein